MSHGAHILIDPQVNVLGLPVLITQEEQAGALGWTDGSLIYLPIKTLERLQQKTKLSTASMSIIINSIVYHESGHVLLTDFQLWELFITMFKTEFPAGWMAVRDIANILEDIRIEFHMGVEYPRLAPTFRNATRLLAGLPQKKEEEDFLSALVRVLFMTLRYGLYDGDFRAAAQDLAIDHREFISEVFDMECIIMLTESVRGPSSRSALFGALVLFERILSIAAKHYGRDTIQRTLEKWELPVVLLIDSDVLAELSKMLSPDAFEDLLNMVEEMLGETGLLSFKEKGGSKGAGKGGMEVIVEVEDYVFYRDTIAMYRNEIMQLRKSFEMLARDWEQDLKRWGSPIEDELPQAYIWSLTKDVPAPRAFEGYRMKKPAVNIVLLIDQSGSMEGDPGVLAMRCAVIVAETIAPILDEGITLSVYTFGDTIRTVKSPTESITQGRFYPRPGGGTSVFESLRRVADEIQPGLNPRAKKIISVFTDSYNSDNISGGAVSSEVREMLSPLLLTCFSTVKDPEADLTQHFDLFTTISSIDEFPDAFGGFLVNLMKNLSRTPTT